MEGEKDITIIKLKGEIIIKNKYIKYLVPRDLTMGQFLYIIRRRLHISPEKAIFLFVKNTIPSTTSLINEVYERYKDDDGYLYISYSQENTFG